MTISTASDYARRLDEEDIATDNGARQSAKRILAELRMYLGEFEELYDEQRPLWHLHERLWAMLASEDLEAAQALALSADLDDETAARLFPDRHPRLRG
jgi:hypothetical protein